MQVRQGCGWRRGGVVGGLAAIALGLGATATPGAVLAGPRIVVINDVDGTERAVEFTDGSVIAQLLQVRELALIARRERALQRAERAARRGDFNREDRALDRAQRAEDMRFVLGRLGVLSLIREDAIPADEDE
jgi:hypothetical protein